VRVHGRWLFADRVEQCASRAARSHKATTL
jgi:hypothetical protein